MKKIILVLLMILLSGCGVVKEEIPLGGSNTVSPLMEAMIDDYKAEFPSEILTYDGPGSSKGIEGIKNGIYQFGFLSREIKDKEKDGEMNVEILALDGIVVIVNKNNPINNLTQDQIKKIYTGEITNWDELGGNGKISVVARDSASGTRSAFDELLKIDAVTTNAILYDSNGAVTQAVEQNKDAIGYISFATYEKNKEFLKGINVDGVAPTRENVISDKYKLYRPFMMVYYPNKLTNEGQKFLEWINQNKNRIVIEQGFIPNGEDNE